MTKFLIIRFSSIGDIVLTTPVIRCLKLQYADAEIHYLTKHAFQNILLENPYLSKVFAFKKSVSEVISLLKTEDYDFIIDLHHNIRSTRVITQLRKPFGTFEKLNFKKFLLVNFKLNVMPNTHIVDRYMQVVKHLGVVNDEQGLDFFIPAKDEINKANFEAPFNNNYIAFVIGAQHFTKRLPNDKIISICKLLSQPIILIGGKEDYENGEVIAQAVGNLIINACGKYNLFQSASLIKNSLRVITHDTGMMHIAAAFKKPIISVWGNTVPAFGMYPYMPHQKKLSTIVEVKNLSCRPCSKIGKKQCPKGHFKCMNDIDTKLFLVD